MIHFDFIVKDEDAEVIFDCINAEINRCHRRITLSDTTEAETEWYNKHIKYLKSLKIKMLNSRAVITDIYANA